MAFLNWAIIALYDRSSFSLPWVSSKLIFLSGAIALDSAGVFLMDGSPTTAPHSRADSVQDGSDIFTWIFMPASIAEAQATMHPIAKMDGSVPITSAWSKT